MIDYGVIENKVHLGVVPDTYGGSAAALTNTDQDIGGVKTFAEVVTSPNSAATITDAMPVVELLTRQQLDAFVTSKKVQIPKPFYIIGETPLDDLLGRPLKPGEEIHFHDPGSGQHVGTIVLTGGGGTGAEYKKPPKPGAPTLSPLPEAGTTLIIPDGKVGGYIGGNYWTR
jgi:hypothetical protein